MVNLASQIKKPSMATENIPLTTGNHSECIILLHGLARTSRAMAKAEAMFSRQGYHTLNVNYPSREYIIEDLSPEVIGNAIKQCSEKEYKNLHFFTHSMGGILLRYFLQHHDPEGIGRAVMLSPPNQGSEIVDELAGFPGFKFLNGPAGLQLGTDANSIPSRLGPINIETGIITGSKSINPMLSRLIKGANDGKVSVASARLEKMTDFLVVPYTHTFIMRRDEVIRQALYFFQNGLFYR